MHSFMDDDRSADELGLQARQRATVVLLTRLVEHLVPRSLDLFIQRLRDLAVCGIIDPADGLVRQPQVERVLRPVLAQKFQQMQALLQAGLSDEEVLRLLEREDRLRQVAP